MKRLLLAVLSLFQSVSCADLALSQETMRLIDADLADDGRAMVIVGLSDPATATELSDSTIKCLKTRFLHSTSMAHSSGSLSIQVVDELENLPFIILNVDRNGLDVIKKHFGVTSIEADTPIKLP